MLERKTLDDFDRDVPKGLHKQTIEDVRESVQRVREGIENFRRAEQTPAYKGEERHAERTCDAIDRALDGLERGA